ncbi:MAG: type II secretion system F family protein [Acidobacteria bacterium]|nr:MAG: type II secretion system F family protein [Acidobacteriota bacterium]
MAIWLIPLLGFLVGALVVAGGYAAVRYLPEYMVRRRIEARMRDTAAVDTGPANESELIKAPSDFSVPVVDALLSRSKLAPSLGSIIGQAGLRTSGTAFVLLTLVCGAAAGATFGLLTTSPWGLAVGAVVGLATPPMVLLMKRGARLRRFEEQFPEALDLLSRAIRAGHALTTALGMVAEEAVDPIGPEFRKTYDEQNYGLPLRDALENLAVRVPLLDVRFFVTAVLIQRETGGNLSEILDNLAHVVRERFKILRQVRVHTAHGRYTGYVLMALPAFLIVALWFINPEHIGLLFTERMGQTMLIAAVVLQIFGYLWIKRIVKIEV